MKDSNAKFEEWWEVVEEYFTKELENNIAQHRVDEKNLRYKLEAYQNNFLDSICGRPISIKVTGQDEEIEARPNGVAQEEELKIEEPQDLKSVVAHEEKVQPKIWQDLRGRGQEEKKPQRI